MADSGVLGLDWFEDKITANDDRVPIVLFIPGNYHTIARCNQNEFRGTR